ncbi:ATP-dependent helicase [Anaerolineales bacterium HSG25]|nr:ATP-dependent helicase [Anaerolineales bacterium HSG25]
MTNTIFTPRPSQTRILETLLSPHAPKRVGVSAAPGSGKTHILSYLASKLVERVDDHQEVLVVTLVNAAVDNFRRKVNEFVREQGLLPGFNYRVCTLHSLAHDIVRQRPALVGLTEEFTIEDDRRTQLILRDVSHAWLANNADSILDYLNPEVNQNRVLRRNLPDLVLGMAQNFIKKAKDLGLTPRQVEERLGPDMSLPLARLGLDIYREYQARLARTGVDFDDLIRLAAQAIEIDPDYRQRLQQQWPYILEDEAQDSSLLQEKILSQLAGTESTWVRVGDPNQAIYETFTTASPENLRNFLQEPDVVGLDMPESGRFSLSIMQLANQLIHWTMTDHPHAEVRPALAPPFIEPTPADDPQPNPPDLPKQIHLRTEKYQPAQEIKTVVKSVKQWLAKNPTKTVAILDPRNKRGVDIVTELRKLNLPYVELLKSTTATRSTAGVLGNVLRHLAAPEEPKLLATVFRVWKRDIWQDEQLHPIFRQVESVIKKCPRVEDFLWPQAGQDWLDSDMVREVIEWGITEFDRFHPEELPFESPFPVEDDISPYSSAEQSAVYVRGLFTEFRQVVCRWQSATILPIDQLVLTLAQDLFTQPADLALSHKFALVLHQWGIKYPEYRLPQFVEILAEVARNERGFLGFDEETLDPELLKGKVTIATMHRAKGLEWDRVYLMGLNNYSFPSGDAYDSYFSEKWFIRDSLNMEAETLAQLEALVKEDDSALPLTPSLWEGELASLPLPSFEDRLISSSYVEGEATQQARIDLVKERLRLLFVGITRARQELVITWNMGRQMPNRPDNQPALPYIALQSWWRTYNEELRMKN